MARTKAIILRRFPPIERRNTRSSKTKTFKIKQILPQQKKVDIKKNGQITKTIRVRRTSGVF